MQGIILSSRGKPMSDMKNSKTGNLRKGRGAQIDPTNRFFTTRLDQDIERESWEDIGEKSLKTLVSYDNSKTILTQNKSPDVGFRFSINPYRGCEHGCSYCYARPTHENLGFNAGIDFESKIVIKPDAPKLLREALMKPSWQPEVIVMSGVTDCYQPLERKFRLTRGCLEVLREFQNPTALISKNFLITRDIDIFAAMAEKNLLNITISITSLDAELISKMEPRTSPPKLRLEAIRLLSEAGVPVNVNVAPIIPGLTDKEVPRILEAAAKAGARSAEYVMLRLPWTVRPIFVDWLETHFPLRAQHVRTQIEDVRDGDLYDTRWGSRMKGEGAYALQLETMFKIFRKKFGLDGGLPQLDTHHFRRPGTYIQRELFSDD